MTLFARFDELAGRPVSMRAFALLRIPVGVLVVVHLQPFLADASAGRIYRDRFHEPYLSWYPELPRAAYLALLWLVAAAGVTLALGLFTRVSAVVAFGGVAYNLFLSTTHVHNNRAYLLIVLAALSAGPCGRELSLDAWQRGRRGLPSLPTDAPGWPLWLLRFEASVVYLASGVSKLVDPDWFGGAVTWGRVMAGRSQLAPLPDWVQSALVDRDVHTWAAKAIVLTELFIGVGLWFRPTRYAAVAVAVVFHITIGLTAAVQVFSYLAIAVLVIWLVPATPTHQRQALAHSRRPADPRRAAPPSPCSLCPRFSGR